MSKYKFVSYEKLDSDAHTDRMLGEQHEEAPEEITNKQLDSYRSKSEPEVTIEKLLENKRTGSSDVILERNLDTSKDQFGSNHRDASTYEGDIPKLEEKRLASENVYEKEEYEPASETPKRQRWWEVKSEDGLKIAFKKEAQDFDADIDWESLDRRYGYEDDEIGFEDVNEDFPIDSTEADFPIDDIENFEIDENDFDIDDAGFQEIDQKIVDVGGTPTAVGKIKFTGPEDALPSDIEEELKDYMEVHHSELPFSMSSFDFSKLRDGVISYQIGVGSSDDILASSKWQIVEASKKKTK